MRHDTRTRDPIIDQLLRRIPSNKVSIDTTPSPNWLKVFGLSIHKNMRIPQRGFWMGEGKASTAKGWDTYPRLCCRVWGSRESRFASTRHQHEDLWDLLFGHLCNPYTKGAYKPLPYTPYTLANEIGEWNDSLHHSPHFTAKYSSDCLLKCESNNYTKQ